MCTYNYSEGVTVLNTENRRSGLFVVPGSKLGVIEEFLPGQGTYTECGNLYSKTIGILLMDLLNKTISVYPKVRSPLFPKIGSLVLGQVMMIKNKSLELRIFEIDGRSASGFFSGLIHISNSSRGYVKTMFDIFNVGDIVRAKVISTANRVFHLTTEGERLGVVYAICPHCGQLLTPSDDLLKCTFCKQSKKRMVAPDYGKCYFDESKYY